MLEKLQFYIDGKWVDPIEPRTLDVINPATEEAYGRISLGSAADVDVAVAAAKRAFESYSQSTREERMDLLQSILEVFTRRHDEVAEESHDLHRQQKHVGRFEEPEQVERLFERHPQPHHGAIDDAVHRVVELARKQQRDGDDGSAEGNH